MLADWHYDHLDPRCPHDSKIEALTIKEKGWATDIEISLSGAYGGVISLSYSNVFSYSMKKRKADWPAEDFSHGDWIADEVTLEDDGFLIHEIVFINAIVKIKCKDLAYKAR